MIYNICASQKREKKEIKLCNSIFLCILENLGLLYFNYSLHQNLMAVNIFIQENRILD